MILGKKIAQNGSIKKPVIYGFAGQELTDEEKYFFKESGPTGFILFSRNIKDKAQVKKLTDSLRELMEGEVLILVDQEGGRVARLKGGEWSEYPAAEHFANLYLEDPIKAKKACYENTAKIARDLIEVGINVDCAPVLDIRDDKTHQVIGNRAFGSNPHQISDLAREVCNAFLDNKIYPVIKHIPGHGRAQADSHLELPVVDADLFQLEQSDFVPFMDLSDMKFAMTAHILYSKLDDKLPATISKKMIDLIRNKIGFKNILMSDDLSMKALPGTFAYRTKATIEAGCDMVLHCNGLMAEMQEIDQNLSEVTDEFLEKLSK